MAHVRKQGTEVLLCLLLSPPRWVSVESQGRTCGKAPEHMAHPEHSCGEAASAWTRSYQTSPTSPWGYSVTPQTEHFKHPQTPVGMGKCVDEATHQALVQAPPGPLDLLVCGVGVCWRLVPSSPRQAASVPNTCPTSRHGPSALHLAELGWFAAVRVPAGAWHWAAFPRNASHLELPFLALPHLLTWTESY